MQMKAALLSLLLFTVGVIILLEQVLNYGVFFEISDIHHETFAIGFFALALGVLIGTKLSRK